MLMDDGRTMPRTFLALSCATAATAATAAALAQQQKPAPPSSCSLAGSLDSGACRCDPGWRGETCSELDLGDSVPAVHQGNWSWGGSPILGPGGVVHLFVSVMAEGCGLLHYQTNSVVEHHVSESGASGPFQRRGIALAPRPGHWDSGAIHGPSIHYDGSSGLYVLFHTGFTHPGPKPNCTQDPTFPVVMVSPTRRIGVAWSAALDGPWERGDAPVLGPGPKGSWDSTDVSNAAPCVLPNGTVLLGFRAGGDTELLGGGIGLAVADHFLGPYRRISGTKKALFAAEDGYLWATPRGFHMLVHAFVGPGSRRPGLNGVGGLAWSRDGHSWSYSASPSYTTAVAWQNGSVAALYRRERPQPLIGSGGRVVALYNGAWPCKPAKEDFGRACITYTMFSAVM